MNKLSPTGYQAPDFHKGHCPFLLIVLKALALDRAHSLHPASASLGQTPWPRDQVLSTGHSSEELSPEKQISECYKVSNVADLIPVP